MASPRPLILLAPRAEAPSRRLRSLWKRSDLAGRLSSLGEVWSFGPALWPRPAQPWPTVPDRPALLELLRGRGFDRLLILEPEQLFLDLELARSALAAFDPTRLDSFTQWEHCRLPVGVGVRLLSARTFDELGAAGPHEAFEALRAAPAGRAFGYEVRRRVSFEESLLDARFAPALEALLAEAEPAEWSLEGFLALARAASDELRGALRHRASSTGSETASGMAPRIDERGLPAPYGFESAACASFPTYVMFDVTNLCNARCIHCPQSLRGVDGSLPAFLAEREHQSLETFRRVIDECAEHDVRFVRITADGEPLVHPELFTMLEYARDRGVGPVGLTTNGSLLTEERAERLLASGVSLVDFSLDAASEETFRRVRVGLDWKRTVRNVERFLALRDRHGARVRVVTSFVKQESNHHEVEAFRARWAPLVDEVVVREMISNVGLNTPSESLWPGWDARWPCAHFFRRVVINHQGLLKACPIDWEQRTVNRPVREVSIREQWHGDFYWSHRMQHLNDAIDDASACKRCPDWAGTPWDLGYEKIVERLVGGAEAA